MRLPPNIKQNHAMDAKKIVQSILDSLAYTVSTHDLRGHMKLISKDVKVLGLGNQVIDYKGWKTRRHNEFGNRLLRRISYGIPNIVDANDTSITFTVMEHLKATDGKAYKVNKEVILLKEPDGVWRILLETYKKTSCA